MSASKTLFIVDPLSDAAVEILSNESSIKLENRPGLALEEKLAVAREAHGIILRSQTRIDADFLAACERLEIIVRAGVGVDNIDVAAATRKGVVVQNIPEGNIRSAAEHSIAMLLALARNIPQAVATLRGGKWDRKSFVGREVRGKVLGIVGLGKIGRQVMHMALGLGMKTVCFDPFVSPQVAEELGVPLVGSLEDLVSQVDFLSLHVPLSDETRGMVSSEVLAAARRGLYLVNCARGGIVDERALLEALESGQVGAAALDAFSKEPPDCEDLLRHERVIATPHLGASTREAQLNVATAAARQMLDYFLHGKLTSPVNTLSLEPEILAGLEPYSQLAHHLGALQSQVLEGNPSRVSVRFFGDLFDSELQRYLTAAALVGFLRDRCSQPVNPINAHHLASEMGLVVEDINEGKSKYFHQMIRVQVTDGSGVRTVGGTIRGQKGLRLVSLDDYHFDAVLEGSLLLIQNRDRPGMIGEVGKTLSDHKVNISNMSLGRDRSGGTAMALLNLDEPVPADIARDLESNDGILWARLVRFPGPSS